MDIYYVVRGSDLTVQPLRCSKEQLVEKLREIRDEELAAPYNNKTVVVQGAKIGISKGEPKYIMFPDGSNLPLNSTPRVIEVDENDRLVEPVVTEEEVVQPELSDYMGAKDSGLDDSDMFPDDDYEDEELS